MNVEQVWSEYRGSLKSFLHSRVADPDEVDDLLQEILIKTHQKIHTIHNKKSIKPWLFQVASNAIADFYRKRSRSPALEAGDLWYGDDEENLRNELSLCVEPFIDALSNESARLLKAVDLEGRSQRQYADQLGISYSTLKSRVRKSRSELRRLFDRCCEFRLDRSGNVVECTPRTGGYRGG